MLKRLCWGAVVLAVAVGLGFYAYRYFQSDESKIKDMFERLSDNVSKRAGEGTTSMVIKTQSLGQLFHQSCSLSVPKTFLSGTYTPEEICSHAVKARKRFKTVALNFHDLTVEVEGEDKASAVFTVRLTGELKSGKDISEAREMTAGLIKKEGSWLFKSFQLVEVLRK